MLNQEKGDIKNWGAKLNVYTLAALYNDVILVIVNKKTWGKDE